MALPAETVGRAAWRLRYAKALLFQSDMQKAYVTLFHALQDRLSKLSCCKSCMHDCCHASACLETDDVQLHQRFPAFECFVSLGCPEIAAGLARREAAVS